ncbi:hypothetical protein ACLK2A_14955 [Escherichia coli]
MTRFIVAGGETSGVVTQSLGIKGFGVSPDRFRRAVGKRTG